MSPWKLVSIWFLLPHAVVVKKKKKKNKKMKRETAATQSNSFAIYG